MVLHIEDLTMNPKKEKQLRDWLYEYGPIIPLLALLATIPYVLIYLKNLWELAHYQFFPLLIAAVVYLCVQRWGGRLERPKLLVLWLAWVLLAGGCFGILCGTTFASPWMAFFGFACCLTTWLAYHQDRETGGSLIYLALPICLIWQPPYSRTQTGDTILIQQLQTISARVSSMWLDTLGYTHFQPGTVLDFAGKSFGVAQACSGIQSFFAVLCVSALLIAILRRGPIHSLLLLGTSPFWAVLMNTIRITLIPVAYSTFGIDLSHGFLHDMLGYGTMALAIGLLLSTDELLLAASTVFPNFSSDQRGSLATSDQLDSVRHTSAEEKKSGVKKISILKPGLLMVTPLVLISGAFFLIQSYDTSVSWGSQRKAIDFFRDEPLVNMSIRDLPGDLLGWRKLDYDQQNRERDNDDLGQRSDVWFYGAPFARTSVAFDQMFPGWHELVMCYQSAGWKLEARSVLPEELTGEWRVVQAEFSRPNEHGFLLWSLKDRSGNPVRPPGEWNQWTSLKERLQGRLSPSVRGTLFGIAAYQAQIFAPTARPIGQQEKDAMLERFLIARELLWEAAGPRLAELE